ncbi:MAG TPA: ornithine carbamoyltransferase, partial [Aigarchaeota archaeon]|nr:ornithine carbamoyltransferase [Aigarchaeota archaeon]
MKLVKHFLEFDGYSRKEVSQIINSALKLKKQGYPANKPLKNKVAALIFQKPSTRTRVSFEGGLARLGGYTLYLGWQELQLGRGESVADTARVMSRYVDCIVARVYSHATLVEMAGNSRVPVVNALSDKHHPCQALADIMTVWEYSRRLRLRNVKIAYVGDGNNVCNSLIQICALLGMRLSVATPREYKPDDEIVKKSLEWAGETGAVIELLEEPDEAVKEADFVYTDVFISMGQEEERQRRIEAFLP